MNLSKSLMVAATAATMAFAAAPAMAITMAPGDSNNIAYGDSYEYFSSAFAAGSTVDISFGFTAVDEVNTVSTAITLPTTGGIKDLVMFWSSDSLGSVALSAVVAFTNAAGAVILPFAELFYSIGAGETVYLVAQSATNGVIANNTALDIRVEAVPLPAPVLLLGSGLFGLGFLARRRRDA